MSQKKNIMTYKNHVTHIEDKYERIKDGTNQLRNIS